MARSPLGGRAIGHHVGMARRPPTPRKPGRSDPSPGAGKVMVGWITGGHPSRDFCRSLSELMLVDSARGGGHIATVTMMAGSPRPAENRTLLVQQFLGRRDADWLLMLDDDMAFAPEVVEQMMAVADPTDVPVLGGLTFVGDGDRIKTPTIYAKDDSEPGFPGAVPVTDFPSKDCPAHTLVRVFATGGACLLVHRSVFVAMAKAYGKLPNGNPNPYPWFTEGVTSPGGVPVGEDIAFCMRMEPLGIPVHVHTGIEFGHIKTATLTYSRWKEQNR